MLFSWLPELRPEANLPAKRRLVTAVSATRRSMTIGALAHDQGIIVAEGQGRAIFPACIGTIPVRADPKPGACSGHASNMHFPEITLAGVVGRAQRGNQQPQEEYRDTGNHQPAGDRPEAGIRDYLL
jgi:hypothetical protein